MGVEKAIKSQDAFPRVEEHLLQKTQFGANREREVGVAKGEGH